MLISHVERRGRNIFINTEVTDAEGRRQNFVINDPDIPDDLNGVTVIDDLGDDRFQIGDKIYAMSTFHDRRHVKELQEVTE
jgi:hypothetical protein